MGCSIKKQQYKEQQKPQISLQDTSQALREGVQSPQSFDISSPRQENLITLKRMIASSNIDFEQLSKPRLKKSSYSSFSRSRRQLK